MGNADNVQHREIALSSLISPIDELSRPVCAPVPCGSSLPPSVVVHRRPEELEECCHLAFLG